MVSIVGALQPVPSFPLKILLIDDQLIVVKLIEKIVKESFPDAEFHYCQEGKKALEKALEINPSLILQDLIMPDQNGMDCLVSYRRNPKLEHVPVIVLSGEEDPLVKAEAFSKGANDYIVKLPDKVELAARIRYHSESYIRLQERNRAFSQLEISQHALNTELIEAAEYVRSLLPPPLDKGEVLIEWAFIPSTQLGGDAFGYHELSEDLFAIYLLDVCGHGVGAALLSISVINALRSQTLQNAVFSDPASVLKALNRAFQMETQHNMFFTMWYGVFSKKSSELTYASAGHPPALLTDTGSSPRKKIEALRTPAPAIGIDLNAEFLNRKIKISSKDVLYLFSDGVVEIEKKEGDIRTFAEWTEFLKETPYQVQDEVKAIVDKTQKNQSKPSFPDDFSLLKITFPAALS